MSSQSVEILGAGGPIAAALPAYETRDEQLRMAEAVEKAIFGSHNLVVEAGTGVGKSFAYLVPAILATAPSQTRIVITTHTISLQEQLIEKDIPFLEKHLGIKFNAVLAKGRSNYLCIRRLEQAHQHAASLFEESEAAKDLNRVIDWAYTTATAASRT